MKLEKREITVEMNLSNVIEEAREVSKVFCEFADELERIERKHKELRVKSEEK